MFFEIPIISDKGQNQCINVVSKNYVGFSLVDEYGKEINSETRTKEFVESIFQKPLQNLEEKGLEKAYKELGKVMGSKLLQKGAKSFAGFTLNAAEMTKVRVVQMAEMLEQKKTLDNLQMVINNEKATSFETRRLNELDDSIRKLDMLKKFYDSGDAEKLIKLRNANYIKDQFNRGVKSDDKIYTAALYTSIGGYNKVDPSTKAPDIWYSKDKGSFDFVNYQKLDKWVMASSKYSYDAYMNYNKYPRNPTIPDKLSSFYNELDKLSEMFGD